MPWKSLYELSRAISHKLAKDQAVREIETCPMVNTRMKGNILDVAALGKKDFSGEQSMSINQGGFLPSSLDHLRCYRKMSDYTLFVALRVFLSKS